MRKRSSARARGVPRARASLKAQEERIAWALILPAIVLWTGLYILPFIYTFIASFEPVSADIRFETVFRPEILSQMGLQNYLRSLSDSVWLQSIWNTVVLVSSELVLCLSLSLGIALILNQSFLGRGIVRSLVLLPWAVAPIVNGMMWNLIFNAHVGTANSLLHDLGLIDHYIIWLSQPNLATMAIVLAITWRFIPLTSLFLLAGLQSIPRELYENAQIDGAGPLQAFRHITLPGIRGVLAATAVLLFMWTTKVFGEIWALTRGGPSYSTTVMNWWIYRQAFEFLRYGYGSALAFVLTLFTGVAIILNHFLELRREEV